MNHTTSAKACYFCKDATENPVELGEMLHYKKINAHTYCLFLSSGLQQSGEEHEGMLGFLKSDIEKEVARAAKLKCVYCKERGACIGCCDKKCHRAFHLPCAIKRDCLFQFADTFRSFCHEHHGIKAPKVIHSATHECCICLDQMGQYAPVRSMQAPCCKNWFHKRCLMENALSHGYYFKCPLCNDKDKFREKLAFQGIFIPDKDAAWEEPDAFAELHERPKKCAAIECKCPIGREHSSNIGKYAMLYCKLCGSHCVHKHCNGRAQFKCKECTDFENRPIATQESPEDSGSSGSANQQRNSGAVLDWLDFDQEDSEVLVHTQTAGFSNSTNYYNTLDSDSEHDNSTCPADNGRSRQIESDDEDTNDEAKDDGRTESTQTDTASESGLMATESNDTSADDGASAKNTTDDTSDDDIVSPVRLSPGKSRLRMSSSSSDDSEIVYRPNGKRSRKSIVQIDSSDDENQDAINPGKTSKLNINNNNITAGSALLRDNQNTKFR